MVYSIANVKMAILTNGHKIRLDIGNYCNLDCPSCFRQEMTRLYNREHNANVKYHPYLNKHNVTVDEIKDWFPPKFLRERVYEMSLCGASAEPSINPYCLDIVDYFKEHVEKISISTNGSTNNTDWWFELGKRNVEVLFSIDSLKPNNNIYRINSNTDKIIENMKAFISGGGNAILKHILFKHNQDEVSDFKELSKKLGCELKVVCAFEFDDTTTSYEVQSKGKTYLIEKNTLIDKNPAHRTKNPDPKSYCALTYNKMFIIHSNGVIYPCCFIEGQFFEIYEDFFIDETKTKPNLEKHPQIVKDFITKIEMQGGIKSLSLKYNKIEDILNSSFFRKTLEMSWKLQSNKTCMECKNGSSTYYDNVDAL